LCFLLTPRCTGLHTGRAGLGIGHDALGGGDDGNAQAIQDLGQRFFAAILAQTGARDALEGFDHRAALIILERDLKLGLVVFERIDAQIGNIAFVLEDLGDSHFDIGSGQFHRRFADRSRIFDADKQISDGISHAHAINLK